MAWSFSPAQQTFAVVLSALAIAGVLWRRVFRASARESARELVMAPQRTIDDDVLGVVERNPLRMRAFMMRDDMFGKEYRARDEAAVLAHATAARVESMALNFGDLPHTLERLADAFDRNEKLMERFMGDTKRQHERIDAQMRSHAIELGEVRGAMGTWEGPDRRHSQGRRAGDAEGE